MNDYLQSPSGKKEVGNFLKSPSGKDAVGDYLRSAEGKDAVHDYARSNEGEAAATDYFASSDGRQEASAYLNSTPGKALLDKYLESNEGKATVKNFMWEKAQKVFRDLKKWAETTELLRGWQETSVLLESDKVYLESVTGLNLTTGLQSATAETTVTDSKDNDNVAAAKPVDDSTAPVLAKWRAWGITFYATLLVLFLLPFRFEHTPITLWDSRGGKMASAPSGGTSIRFRSLSLYYPGRFAANESAVTSASGVFLASSLTAVMGCSGSGKSSLFKTLAGPLPSGAVVIGGGKEILRGGIKTQFSSLHVGVVPQTDTMYNDLTVNQTINFAASLYAPLSRSQENARDAIARLKLTQSQTKRITEISGGQKKRVNIALELVSEPDVLFLDEPTSGLDASLSHELVEELHVLAHGRNKTIISVIHSPASHTFALFDWLHLMTTQGRTIYSGPVKSLMGYFASQKYDLTVAGSDGSRQPILNPADVGVIVAGGVAAREVENDPSSAVLRQTLAVALWDAECAAAYEGAANFCSPLADETRHLHNSAARAVLPLKEAQHEETTFVSFSRILYEIPTVFIRSKLLLKADQITCLLVAAMGAIAGYVQQTKGRDFAGLKTMSSPSFAMGSIFVALTSSVQLYDVEIQSGMFDRERITGLSPVALFLAKNLVGLGLSVIIQLAYYFFYVRHRPRARACEIAISPPPFFLPLPPSLRAPRHSKQAVGFFTMHSMSKSTIIASKDETDSMLPIVLGGGADGKMKKTEGVADGKTLIPSAFLQLLLTMLLTHSFCQNVVIWLSISVAPHVVFYGVVLFFFVFMSLTMDCNYELWSPIGRVTRMLTILERPERFIRPGIKQTEGLYKHIENDGELTADIKDEGIQCLLNLKVASDHIWRPEIRLSASAFYSLGSRNALQIVYFKHLTIFAVSLFIFVGAAACEQRAIEAVSLLVFVAYHVYVVASEMKLREKEITAPGTTFPIVGRNDFRAPLYATLNQVLVLAALYLAYNRAYVGLQVMLLGTLAVSKLFPHVVVHEEYKKLTLDGCFPTVAVSVRAKTDSLTNGLRLVTARLSMAVVLWSLSDTVKERLPFADFCITVMCCTEAVVLAVEAFLLSRHFQKSVDGTSEEETQHPSASIVSNILVSLSFTVNLAYTFFYILVVGPVLFGGDAGGVSSSSGNAPQHTQFFMIVWFMLWLFYFSYEVVDVIISGKFSDFGKVVSLAEEEQKKRNEKKSQ